MKNKGFTLVELLGVLVIISILGIILIPNVINSLNAGKNKLSDYQKKMIEDAAQRAVLEVISCDISDNTYYALNLSNSLSCSDMQDRVINNTINTSVDNLKIYKYIEDVTNICTGDISITTDSNYNIKIDISKVECN